jgi:serine/threonine-protein kinase
MSGRLSQYNTLGRLGAGAMGELYRARDTRHGRTVALRILPPAIAGDPERRLRFLHDAERAAALSHPNIATLYDVGEDGDQLFAAFEFVPGDSLKSIIAAGPIHPHRAVQAAAQIADALAEGHSRGMVHGALDAEHVVITPKGNAKVLDFGLSSWSGAPVQTSEADAFDDLAALGLLLQDMARGTPTSGQRRTRPEIDRIVARALCEDPEQRYDSAAALAADLRAVDAALESEHARTPDRTHAVPPRLVSRPLSNVPRVVLALVIAAVAGASWVARDRLTRTWKRAAASPSRAILAVGPFQRGDGSRDYISEGIRQDLAARLGQTSGIQVVGRTLAPTVRSVANVDRPVGAGAVLEGTVGLGGGDLTIAVRLTDTATSDEIWSRDYRRELKDVFPLQSQIAEDVTRAIGVPAKPTAATERDAARIVDPMAYDAYLRGKNAASEGRLPDAEAILARAVQLDDGLAEAHASLVSTLSRLALRGGQEADSRWQRAKHSADRALELAPDLPAANLAAAAVADSLASALNALKAAIRFDPSYAEGYREIAEQIRDFDDVRAEKFRAKALAIDPAQQTDDGNANEPAAESCAAIVRAAVSGTERRQTASVRARLNAFVDSGNTESAGPYAARCAALAAAALGKGPAASAVISRIATNEDFLRIWAVRTEGLAGSNALRRGSLPWSRVEDQPAFTSARTALEQVYDRARRQIAASLDGLAF